MSKKSEESEVDVYADLEKSFKKRGLGRGLNALFEDEESDYPQVEAKAEEPAPAPEKATGRKMIPIAKITPGRYQPRTIFQEGAINELAESMKQHGVLQPILVREVDEFGTYEIVAGERRWRAAQRANLHEVPVIIRDFTDKQALEIGLIENLQRVDLNPLDEAAALKQLMEDFRYSQNEVAETVGKSRPYVANMIRLTELPEEIKDFVFDGSLSAGHARALLTCENALEIAKEVIAKGLSVRETERLAAEGRPEKTGTAAKSKASPTKPEKDLNTIALEHELSSKLGLKVEIAMKNKEEGILNIAFKDLDQLDDVIHRLSKK
ncbi:MAG: ParB/RepB/Spo0J family partition protein [Pseudobdellovibrionaceae bacterium]